MIYFLLGLFITSTILLIIFIFKFYDFSIISIVRNFRKDSLEKEKVFESKNNKEEFNDSDIDKSSFFK